MSKFMIVDPFIGLPLNASQTGTTQLFDLGLEVRGADRASAKSSANMGGGVFIYAAGSNVTAIGQFVHFSSGSGVLLASANSASFFPIGVAAGNLSATNVFGWVQVQGNCDYAQGTNSAIAAGVPLYLAATAGIINSVAGAGSRLVGIVAPASYTSSQSASFTVNLNRPVMIGNTAGL